MERQHPSTAITSFSKASALYPGTYFLVPTAQGPNNQPSGRLRFSQMFTNAPVFLSGCRLLPLLEPMQTPPLLWEPPLVIHGEKTNGPTVKQTVRGSGHIPERTAKWQKL